MGEHWIQGRVRIRQILPGEPVVCFEVLLPLVERMSPPKMMVFLKKSEFYYIIIQKCADIPNCGAERIASFRNLF